MSSPQVYFFGLITYLSAKGLHTSFRDDHIPSATDYIHGFTLIIALRASGLTFVSDYYTIKFNGDETSLQIMGFIQLNLCEKRPYKEQQS